MQSDRQMRQSFKDSLSKLKRLGQWAFYVNRDKVDDHLLHGLQKKILEI